MVRVDMPQDLTPYVGQPLGTSAWRTITEDMVQRFANLTGDTHWIHTDSARVRAQTPFTGQVVHGFLLLALITDLGTECFDVTAAQQWLNYGVDKLRFTSVVIAGARVRLRMTLAGLDMQQNGAARITAECVLEVEGQQKPALVARRIMLAIP